MVNQQRYMIKRDCVSLGSIPPITIAGTFSYFYIHLKKINLYFCEVDFFIINFEVIK